MADRIATGEIYVEVNDREAIAALHRIDAEFDREMRKIDHQSADVKIQADLAPLNDDIANAKRKIKQLEKGKAELPIHANTKQFDERISGARRRLKRLEGEKATVELKLKSNEHEWKAAEARVKAMEARVKAIQKREAEREKALDAAAKKEAARSRDRLKDIDREASRRKSLTDQRLREEKADERAANAMRREQAMVPKLERSYMRLQERLEQLALAKRKAGKNERARLIIDVEEHITKRELEHIRKRVNDAVGRDPVNMPLKPVLGRDAGRNLRLDFERNNRQLGPAAAAAGLRIGHTMGQKITQGFRNITERGGLMANTRALGAALGGVAGRGAASGLSRIGHAFDGLANMTVRLGPFTATIRQLMVVMSLLGPTIVDVVGALGSLVSVVGSGALGLANLGTAIIGGGIPALIGMVTVLKPVVGEMKNASAASQAYAKAVREHGKGSDEAAKKLDIFNNVMKHQSDLTKANFLAAGHLKEAWAKATDPSRQQAFKVMGEGLGFLTRNVQFFGDRTNATFKAVGGSLSRWIRGLDSAEGHAVLGKMMDNFNAALGPALDGLGNLAAVFGRFGASASRFLPDLTQQFRTWTEGLLRGSKNATVVDGKVNKMMDSLKSVGRFLLAGGRLFAAFFGGGVTAGQKFTNTMTDAMNRWTQTLKSPEGQDNLHGFFDRAVAGAQALYGALAPVIGAFIQWSNAISPFATVFFRFAAGVASVVAKILSLTALTGPVQALAATLGTLWALGKIQTATAAVTAFGRALLGLQAAQTGTAALGARWGAVGSSAAAGAQAATAGAAFTRTGGAAAGAAAKTGLLSRAVRGFGGILAGTTPLINPWTVGIVAGGIAAYKFGQYVHGAYEENKKLQGILGGGGVGAVRIGQDIATANAAIKDQGRILPQVASVYSQQRNAVLGVEAAEKQYAMAVKTSGKHSLEARQALQYLRDTRVAARTATQQLDKAEAAYGRDSLIVLGKANDAYQTAKTARDNYYDQKKAQGYTDAEIKSQNTYKLLTQDVKRYLNGVHQAQESNLRASLNWGRALKGLQPLARTAQHDFAALQKYGGQELTKKISLKFEDPGKAASVARSAGRALKSGVPKTLTSKIVTDSKSAEEAVRRLNRAKITPKRLLIIEQGGKEAIRVLEGILGRKLTPKEQRIAEHGGKNVIEMLRNIGRKDLARKVQNLSEHGAATVRAAIRGIQAIRIAAKTVRVTGEFGGVIGGLNSIKDAIASIPRDFSVRGHYSGTGNLHPTRPGFSGGAFKTGAGLVERAMAVAQNRPTRKTRGGSYRAPTMLVGEEGRREFVIATNPAYRKKNQGHVAEAAKALGMTQPIIAAAHGYQPYSGIKTGNLGTTADVRGGQDGMNQGGGLNSVKLKLGAKPPDKPGMPRAARKAKSQKKQDANNAVTASAAHKWKLWLGQMQKGEGMIQREIGVQEGELEQPDSYLVQDPVTKEWSIDEEKEKAYGKQLLNLRKWYDMLLDWIAHEKRNLLNAMLMFKAEENIGKHQRTLYGNKARKQQKQLNTLRGKKKKSSADKKKINALENSLKHSNRKKSQGEGWEREGKEGQRSVSDRTSEIGYDWRGFLDQRNDYEEERAAITGEAAVQLKEQKESDSSSGGGGGGSGDGGDNLSYGEQAVLADTERAGVLRDFGSNYSPNVGGTSGPSSPGVTGLAGGQQSSGALVSNALGSSAASGGSGGSGVGGAVASALAGGATASSAMASLATGGSANPAAGVAGVAGGGTNVTLVNNFQFQPSDPHTYAQGVAMELRAAL